FAEGADLLLRGRGRRRQDLVCGQRRGSRSDRGGGGLRHNGPVSLAEVAHGLHSDGFVELAGAGAFVLVGCVSPVVGGVERGGGLLALGGQQRRLLAPGFAEGSERFGSPFLVGFGHGAAAFGTSLLAAKGERLLQLPGLRGGSDGP